MQDILAMAWAKYSLFECLGQVGKKTGTPIQALATTLGTKTQVFPVACGTSTSLASTACSEVGLLGDLIKCYIAASLIWDPFLGCPHMS